MSGVGVFSHPAWLAVRFEVPSATSVTWKIHGDFDGASSAALGMWLLRGGSVIDNSFSIHRDRFPNVVHAEVDLDRVTALFDSTSGGGAGGRDLTMTNNLTPGTYTAVGLAVSDGSMEGSVELSATGTINILAQDQGNEVFIRDERSFTGLLDVYVQQAMFVRVKAIAHAQHLETVNHSLFGWFGTVSDPGAMLHSDGPDGHRDGMQQYTYGGTPPGTYSMTVDLDAGGPGSATGAFGADVSLP